MTTISNLPTAPQRGQSQEIFNTNTNNWLGALGTMTTQTNSSIGEINADASAIQTNKSLSDTAKTTCLNAEIVALATGYKGNWSALTGALSMPAVVAHNGRLWMLNYNLSQVQTSTPSFSNSAWQCFTPWQINTIDNVYSFSGSTNWTVPEGVFVITLDIIGGGGSGGINAGGTSNESLWRKPGSSGEWVTLKLRVQPGKILNITIGSAGSGISNSSTARNGNAGNTTTVVYQGETFTAVGGAGGIIDPSTLQNFKGCTHGLAVGYSDGAILYAMQKGGTNGFGGGPVIQKVQIQSGQNVNGVSGSASGFGNGGTCGFFTSGTCTSGSGAGGFVRISATKGDY